MLEKMIHLVQNNYLGCMNIKLKCYFCLLRCEKDNILSGGSI